MFEGQQLFLDKSLTFTSVVYSSARLNKFGLDPFVCTTHICGTNETAQTVTNAESISMNAESKRRIYKYMGFCNHYFIHLSYIFLWHAIYIASFERDKFPCWKLKLFNKSCLPRINLSSFLVHQGPRKMFHVRRGRVWVHVRRVCVRKILKFWNFERVSEISCIWGEEFT